MFEAKLNNIDPLDIDDVLLQIERSFDIRFESDDLKNVITLGDVCDVVVAKIKLPGSDTCTTQQAFYKLRKAVSNVTGTAIDQIDAQTKLAQILPYKNRGRIEAAINNELGFDADLLSAPKHVVDILGTIAALSLLGCFYSVKIGLSIFVLSIVCFRLAGYFGTEITTANMGELAKKFSRENYVSVRSGVKTVNRKEVEQKITELFAHHLDLPHSELTREATF